ncbi:MAG TPA: histidine--tRNA ligase [Clostridiales bacterium]|nr:histidine--tRNA ligase [Clostridiales bacterium]
MATSRPKGTNDFLPADTVKWHYVEGILRDLADQYGFAEIRTPIFEATELFLRGVGETTDIVNKEMYTFTDKGERSITLRPENTASTARAFIEHKMYGLPQPVKLYYMGPMFRYERPQKGRFRQFHQFGIEAFGSLDPALDSEVITLAMEFYKRLGLNGLQVRLNSVGCPVCRGEHKAKLQEMLRPHLDVLCADCQSRFERNPLRIFDCKNDKCQALIKEAPTIADCLCDECRDHFEKVKTYLTAAGIPFAVDAKLVRGLDYYTKTAFEIILTEIGAQSAICGGGRYDGLIEDLGGEATPGVGFALGMERIFAALDANQIEIPVENGADVYFIALGEKAREKAFSWLIQLRRRGIKGDMDYMARSFKAQMKAADRIDAKYAVIVGENELQNNEIIIKNMADSSQETIKTEQISEAAEAADVVIEELIRRIQK